MSLSTPGSAGPPDESALAPDQTGSATSDAPSRSEAPASAGSGAGEPAATSPTAAAPAATAPLAPTRTRASSTYVAVAIGLVILVLVIIFIAQNTRDAAVQFLGFKGHLALGLLVLASAVAGGLIVLMVSLARVLQLRMAARRHRQAHTT